MDETELRGGLAVVWEQSGSTKEKQLAVSGLWECVIMMI